MSGSEGWYRRRRGEAAGVPRGRSCFNQSACYASSRRGDDGGTNRRREGRRGGWEKNNPLTSRVGKIGSLRRIGFFARGATSEQKPIKCTAGNRTTKNRTTWVETGACTVIGAGERRHNAPRDSPIVGPSTLDRFTRLSPITTLRALAFQRSRACPAIRPRIRVQRASRVDFSRDAPEVNLRRPRRRAR